MNAISSRAQHRVDGHENEAARSECVAHTGKYGAVARDDCDPIPELRNPRSAKPRATRTDREWNSR